MTLRAKAPARLERIRLTHSEIAEIRAHLHREKPRGFFSWPDDGLSTKDYYYDFHCAWVTAWNAENRATECLPFLLGWLARLEEPDA